MYALSALAPQLIKQSALERGEAWKEYWGAIFRALTGVEGVAMSPCREVRNRGISVLLRVLLSEDLVQPEDVNLSAAEDDDEDVDIADGRDDESETQNKGRNEWTALYTEVLFPLVARLLKPEVHKADPVGMSETRGIMVTVLCKVFLRYFDLLAKLPARTVIVTVAEPHEEEVEDEKAESKPARTKTVERKDYMVVRAWVGTVELLDRLMNASVGTKEGDTLEEAVSEGVKNVLLVLGDGGYLVRPKDGVAEHDEMRSQMWRETYRRLEIFLPGLMAEIFPEEKEITKEGNEERGKAVV